MSLLFLLNQIEDIELLEVLCGLELIDNSFLNLGGIGGSAMSDEQDSRLDEAAELLEGLVKVLLSVDNSEVGGRIELLQHFCC